MSRLRRKHAASASCAGLPQGPLRWSPREQAQWISSGLQGQQRSNIVQRQAATGETAVQAVGSEFADLAHKLADAAAEVTTPYFRCAAICCWDAHDLLGSAILYADSRSARMSNSVQLAWMSDSTALD